jgi:hypothetical protein
VWSRNLENKEAKARYRAVENTTRVGCNARKTNKRLIEFLSPLVGRNFLGNRKLDPHAYDRIWSQKNEILVSNPLRGKDTVSANI